MARARRATNCRRIGYLCNTFGTPDADRCFALAKNGYDVLVFDWARSDTEYTWPDRTVDGVDNITYAIDTESLFSFLIQGTKFLVDFILARPGLILVYGFHNPIFMIAAWTARFAGAITITMNDSRFEDSERSAIRELAKTIYLKPYHASLAASAKAASYVRFLGVENVELYHCAIDHNRLRHLALRDLTDSISSGSPFICVARFAEKKNYSTLIDAYENYVLNSCSPQRLLIIGYGDLEQDIISWVETKPKIKGLVDIWGYVLPDDLPAILGRCRCLILCSNNDQFGIVIVESLALGVPVIASSSCGASELIQDSVNGFCISPNNVQGFSWAMTYIDADESRWNLMSRAAQDSANGLDVACFISGIEKIADRVKCDRS